MAELKPLGSEKLNGDDKLKRILELTYFNSNKNNSRSSSKPELVKESKNGGVYGVVKEKDGYYVKRGLNESSLDYIGGMFMKNKNKFSSYAEAFKRLELLKGQEELQEATKYVLKQNKPQQEAPMPEAPMDLPPAPAADASGDVPPPSPEGEVPMDAPTDAPPAEGGEDEDAGKRSSYMAEAQKYAGKLGQELRDLHDRMESDDRGPPAGSEYIGQLLEQLREHGHFFVDLHTQGLKNLGEILAGISLYDLSDDILQSLRGVDRYMLAFGNEVTSQSLGIGHLPITFEHSMQLGF